jgi:hypothetical protein
MKKSRGSSVEPFTITFRNAEDVIEFAERCRVPRHIDGRQSLDTERWTLGRYLSALAAAGSLAYPLTATHANQSESPDFTLSMPGGDQIGLEVTEASTSDANRRVIKIERSEGKPVFAGRDPEVGEPPAHDLAAIVCERIRKKAEGLASGRWTRADAYDLVLYDNRRVGGADVREALPVLHALLDALPPSGFRRVSIIAKVPPGGSSILIYLEGDDRVLSIPSKRT